MTPSQGAVLVTGASTGIGWATTAVLLHQGFRVLAGARAEEDLNNLRQLGATPVRLDVTKKEDLTRLATTLDELDVPLIGLINNAGVVRGGPWECLEIDDLRNQMEVNFIGVVSVTQIALPHIRKSKGRIINISSISGRLAVSYIGPYAASKFALEAFTDSLRREVAHCRVKVISINPGPIATPIWQKRDAQVKDPLDLLKTEDQKATYSEGIKRFLRQLEQAAASAEPVDLVTDKILKALQDARPKTRYYVGKQAWIVARAVSLVPDRWMDILEKKR